jgi:cellulose synthase (UDP-forming)
MSNYGVDMNEYQGKWALRILIVLGLFALAYYFEWWYHAGRFLSPALAFALALAALYNWVQLVGNWMLYLAAHRRLPPEPASKDWTVDVFVTVCKEPYALIEQSLTAAHAMRGKHQTWLLDDGHDSNLAHLARRLGIGYLTRANRQYAKAGNINAALARTDGDIVVIFDVDHIPSPDFLEKSLGYFADPQVGFVQVMLTFINSSESWVARAANESSLDFYNPTSMGADGIGSATLIGSNALLRRRALESIGGYKPGLAEDLATSIELHAAGWRSVYVPKPLAPGLAPPDLSAWVTQQLKWARGVFELGLTVYPRRFWRLTWGQRLSYAVRMTYYWIGPVIAIHLSLTIALLVWGSSIARVDFFEYLLRVFPLACLTVSIRQTALYFWRHSSTSILPLWRAMLLVSATWHVYTFAWILALLRVPLGFRPTPKTRQGILHPAWLIPSFLALCSLLLGILYALQLTTDQRSWLVLVFASLQAIPQAFLIGLWLRSLSEYWQEQMSVRT